MLTEKKKFLKKASGVYKTAIHKQDGLLYCRWKDNSAVTMLSTDACAAGGKPMRRYSKESKSHIQVYQPLPLANFNKSMGGTDRMDQNISCHRNNIHGNKWWWPIFTWLLDVARQNSYYLYKKQSHNTTSMYTQVSHCMLREFRKCKLGGGAMDPIISFLCI